MVSYYDHLAMYRQQQTPQYPPTPAWYHQPHQQYLPPCMSDMEPHHVSAGSWPPPDTHKYISGHHPAFPSGEWSQDCNHFQPSPPMSEVSSPGAGGLTPPHPPTPSSMGNISRPITSRSPYDWIKKPSYQLQPNPGKTRTKDKYRVVYTDHQRLELEKEFHYSRYITIRRKAELATSLGLSERQVKIWFQNRRAKERKQVKKREETQHKVKQEIIDSCPLSSGNGDQTNMASSVHPVLHHHMASVSLHGGMALM